MYCLYLQMMVHLLKPCRDSTEMLGSESYVSASIVLPHIAHLMYVNRVKDKDDDGEPAYVTRFKNSLRADLKERQENLTKDMFLKTATALDPRHKHLRCIPPEQRDEVWKNV